MFSFLRHIIDSIFSHFFDSAILTWQVKFLEAIISASRFTLTQHRLDAFFQVLGLVEGGGDDGDGGWQEI